MKSVKRQTMRDELLIVLVQQIENEVRAVKVLKIMLDEWKRERERKNEWQNILTTK